MSATAKPFPSISARKTNAHPVIVGSVLVSRTVLLVLFYFIAVWIYKSQNIPNAYDLARPWWPISLLFINGIVLIILFFATRQEGKTLASLVGFDKELPKKDIKSSLWMILVSMVLAVGATMGLGVLFYHLKTPSGLISLSNLPVWAMVLTLAVHPVINAFVEEMTYNGYVFPRLDCILHSSSLAVILVTFFFSLQHIAIPFAFDTKFLLWRFLSFVPLLLFWVLIYAKMRRLPSLIIVHWFMDIFAVLSILFIPT